MRKKQQKKQGGNMEILIVKSFSKFFLLLSNSATLPASNFSGFHWQFFRAISGDKIRLLCADLPEYYLTSKSNIQRGTLKTANSAVYKRFFYFKTYQGGYIYIFAAIPGVFNPLRGLSQSTPSFTLSELVTDLDNFSSLCWFPTFPLL